MVSLHRAEDANRLLRGLFYLRSQILRTELFDPSGRLTQCLQCQRYGHVQRGCTFSIRCLYCGEQHRKGDCPQTKVTPDRFTCATCKGPNLAYEKMCPTRLQAAAEADYTRKHKPKYFPEPARPVTSLPIGPPPLTSNPSGDSEQPEEPEPEPAESSAETRKKAKKVVETKSHNHTNATAGRRTAKSASTSDHLRPRGLPGQLGHLGKHRAGIRPERTVRDDLPSRQLRAVRRIQSVRGDRTQMRRQPRRTRS